VDKVFQYLGKRAGKAVKKGKWFYNSVLGSEEDTIKAEFSFGYEMAKEISNKYKLVKEPITIKIGTLLKTKLSTKHRFNFYTIKSDEVNAFALPGGFIFVTNSLLEFCEFDEDAIAFVLAHEMGHVIKGHTLNSLLAQYSVNALSTILRTTGLVQNAAKQLFAKYLITNYSRENEFEADRAALKIMKLLDFNTNAAKTFFENLQAKESDSSFIPSYFATHPPLKDRIKKVEEIINK